MAAKRSSRKLTPNDIAYTENPINWPSRRKWAITLTAMFLSALTALNVTSVAPMSHFAPEWFHVTRVEFQLSLTVMMLAISLTPMILAPLSEVVSGFLEYGVP